MSIIRNLTPHEVVVRLQDGTEVTFHPEGKPARVSVSQVPDGNIDGIPIMKTVLGQVENLPAPQDGVFLIVSGIVKSAVPERDDLLQPDTTPAGVIRNELGQIIAVRGFQR